MVLPPIHSLGQRGCYVANIRLSQLARQMEALLLSFRGGPSGFRMSPLTGEGLRLSHSHTHSRTIEAGARLNPAAAEIGGSPTGTAGFLTRLHSHWSGVLDWARVPEGVEF